MTPERQGILAAGTFVLDRVIVIDAYPPENTLASIEAETLASGGCPYNVLKDLRLLGATFPLAALGALGVDENATWILNDCARHEIDTRRMIRIPDAATSYTYAMTARGTGRRTFFHRRGANARLAPEHFDFSSTDARIFVLGYLVLLDALDGWIAPGRTGAADVLERARAAGMATVVDLVSTPHPSYRDIVRSALPSIDHLLLNELEAATALGRSIAPTANDLLEAARELAAGGVHESVVVHCEEGVVGYDCRSGRHAVAGSVAFPRELVAGATGAGDAFTAGYLWSLHAGEPLALRLRAGVCCAAACLRDASASGGIGAIDACLEIGEHYGFKPFAVL